MRRWPTGLAAGLTIGLACLPSASAGTFTVASCAASATKRSDAWASTVLEGEPIENKDWCVSGEAGTDGEVDFSDARFLRPPIPPPGPWAHTTPGQVARLAFAAPAGGTLVRLTYRRRLQTVDPSWEVRLKAGATLLEDCVRAVGQWQCPDLTQNHTFSADLPTGSSSLELGVWCVQVACPYNPGPLYDFAAVIYSSVVTVEENVLPTAGAPAVSGLTNGWVGAGSTTAAATFAGSDTLGLRRIELVDGAAVVKNVANGGCVDWSVLPCSDLTVPGLGPGFGGSSALTGLADGTHQLRTRATDAAGNQALSSAVTVNVDRQAPSPVVLSQGGTVAGATVPVQWRPPQDGGAPIVGARTKVCAEPSTPTSCQYETVPVDGTQSIQLGPDGTVTTLQIEMTDQAGNVGLSPAIEYRRDSTSPTAPQLSLVAGAGAARSITVATPDADVIEYAVRLCGPAGCTDSRRAASGRVDLDLATPATYRVEIGLIDRAGNAGPASALDVAYDAVTLDDPKKSTALALKKPGKLRARATVIDVAGTVAVGSASAIKVTVKGRPAGGKSPVTYRATAKLSKTGRWAARVKLPRGVSRRHGVLVTVTATPAAGYLGATVSRRIRG